MPSNQSRHVPGQLYDRPHQDPETFELSLQPRRYLGVFRAPNGWLVHGWGPVEEREVDAQRCVSCVGPRAFARGE